MAERRTIRTDYLARVEGEGAMTVRLQDGRVEHVELRIFEPPRFFEALLRGRSCLEAPDITARICGICPVAYQTSAVNALEDLCGVDVPAPIRLRHHGVGRVLVDLERVERVGDEDELHRFIPQRNAEL